MTYILKFISEDLYGNYTLQEVALSHEGYSG